MFLLLKRLINFPNFEKKNLIEKLSENTNFVLNFQRVCGDLKPLWGWGDSTSSHGIAVKVSATPMQGD